LTDPVHSLLAVFAILQIKHFICDYLLQTPYQLLNKGIYLHPGGLLHAGLHALFTVGAFLVAPPALGLGIAIVLGEFLVHYHIDWVKEQVIRRKGWDATQREFWWAIGFDQLLHHLTYILIGGLLVGAF
jgi:Protein of unknown function (DUF3307)